MLQRLLKIDKKIWVLQILSILTSLSFMNTTSPLSTQTAYGDSGIFLVMGRLLSDGKVFYLDLFDHKGPVLFFLTGIPQCFISGTTGVWILQNVFLCASLALVYQMSKKILNHQLAIFPAIAYLLYMIITIAGSNFSEEYSNFFCLIAMAIFVDVVTHGLEKFDVLARRTVGRVFYRCFAHSYQ